MRARSKSIRHSAAVASGLLLTRAVRSVIENEAILANILSGEVALAPALRTFLPGPPQNV